ncbi:MAG: hypothetical protein ABIP55_00900 [Tepidisphaeraceae bacterium]
MKRHAWVIVLAAGGFVGCSTNEVARVGSEPRAEISYAATARYPGDARMSDAVKLTAVTDPDAKKLVIYNVTDNSIGPATVWVNGAFVHRIDGIAPRGAVEINYGELLQTGPGTADLKSLDQPARKVEIQTRDGLFTVQGPSQKL